MNSRQRLLTVLQGGTPDRVPVYTQMPFGLEGERFVPAQFAGYDELDEWRREDPAYVRLTRRMEAEVESFFIYRPSCLRPERIFLPPHLEETSRESTPAGAVVETSLTHLATQTLRRRTEMQPGTGHTWAVEHLCKTPEEAESLLSVSWTPANWRPEELEAFEERLGDRGLVWLNVPSPLLVVCRLFDPEEFLVLIRTHSTLIRELMDLAAARIGEILAGVISQGGSAVIRFGGAEHATPPLASPNDFDELVVHYDAPLVRLCKEAGRRVAVHCHGHLRHALERFVEMGVDQIDPVETEPDGDITLEEAREIAGDAITLTGNIQMREMYAGTPDSIESRVREILDVWGPRRTIITTTGTPLERISAELETNYHRLIDATQRWGETHP